MKGVLIGSGYFSNPCSAIPSQELFEAWSNSIRKHAKPKRVVVVTAGGRFPDPSTPSDADVIVCQGDLGNLSHKVAGKVNHDFAGWFPPMAITAMIAYNECLDFIFQEQDCFAFGPYVEQMYADMGGAQAVIGGRVHGVGEPASQSLFLVRHAYIWQFLRDYLNEGPDDNEENRGEKKFGRMRDKSPNQIKTLSFGSDRDRPIPWNDRVISFQQPSREEFEEAKRRGLIP